GRCGYCEFRKVCGGCRARAFAFTGDYMEEEPFCTYQPTEAAKKAHEQRKGSAV
ncbi:MAG TPA: radical SAM/SPASM domain-containing protein, partial [Thermodesulfobacteriota bacterium]|nr:radical SAM/SPASM domain-containing protein [Thermodesulfobacteriota bacterium]